MEVRLSQRHAQHQMLVSLKSEFGHADFGGKVHRSSEFNRQTTQRGIHFATLAPAHGDNKRVAGVCQTLNMLSTDRLAQDSTLLSERPLYLS